MGIGMGIQSPKEMNSIYKLLNSKITKKENPTFVYHDFNSISYNSYLIALSCVLQLEKHRQSGNFHSS